MSDEGKVWGVWRVFDSAREGSLKWSSGSFSGNSALLTWLAAQLMKARSKIPLTDLRQLANRYGIQTEHRDMFGKRTVASADSLIATLQALGAPIYRMEDIAAALREYEAFSWRSGLEPVVKVGQTAVLPMWVGDTTRPHIPWFTRARRQGSSP